jgi:hypothetical protein
MISIAYDSHDTPRFAAATTIEIAETFDRDASRWKSVVASLFKRSEDPKVFLLRAACLAGWQRFGVTLTLFEA